MCRKKGSSGHYIQIAFGKKFVDLYVCEDCIKKLLDISGVDQGSLSQFSFDNLLKIFFTGKEFTIDNSKKCNICGCSFEDFQKSGILGCPECYEVFKEKIDPIIINYQGSNKHIGKSSKYKESIFFKQGYEKKEIEYNTDNKIQLKIELQKAIDEERYEDAAIIRDRIKESEKTTEC